MLFWFQFIPSAPFRPTLQPFGQAAAFVLTNWIMTIIAIVISFFTNVPLYKFGVAMGAMSRMVGMAMPIISLNRFADQQIGAAILWVCGDFWCFPAVYIAFRRSQSDDNGSDFVTKFLRRHRNMSVDEFTAARESPTRTLCARARRTLPACTRSSGAPCALRQLRVVVFRCTLVNVEL